MPVHVGLVLPGYRPLTDILAPLADELAGCFWLVDVQLGVFNAEWMLEEANETLLEKLFWRVPGFKNSSTLGLRPGSLPRLAPHLNVDEWSYYIAIDRPEDEALKCAERLARHNNYVAEPFLKQLETLWDLFICHADGWWEFYSAREDWYQRLQGAWPEVRERAVREAGTPPR
jgi:hypothetical protein